ncbi:RnfH family protein [Pasteurellaceae bacterium HPA106]|uniref:RnfH family protein n=1 Tax=Spirabiliibacterium pneumoniae TaxID=221400 RepID=UPI001AACDF53|nr:RnfH family protein [Spirabiliibacterium pneumoniae]MBE2895293.1 RnfH family protein [Spirabiliibacterium pneumoniae]
MADKIRIQIAYARPDCYFLQHYQVEQGTTIQSAVLSSGILEQFHEIDLRKNALGIFARPAKLTDVLQDGDRIEIYRPLLADPKEIRRKRAEQQRLEQEAEKARERALKREQKQLEKERQHDET